LDAQGRVRFTPEAAGRYVVEALAVDATGQMIRSQTILKVRDLLDSDAPTVVFNPAFAGGLLTNKQNLVATITDASLDQWVLEMGQAGSFKTLAQGSGVLAGGMLTQLDPGVLANGFYSVVQ
jgi:hypothetical protein